MSPAIAGPVFYWILLMQRKMFWLIFGGLGLFADFMLPLVWGIAATLPILLLSWWIVYRSGWFE
jgi:hypothetical protein